MKETATDKGGQKASRRKKVPNHVQDQPVSTARGDGDQAQEANAWPHANGNRFERSEEVMWVRVGFFVEVGYLRKRTVYSAEI